MEPSGSNLQNSCNDRTDTSVTKAIQQLSVLDSSDRKLPRLDEREFLPTQNDITRRRGTNIMTPDRKRVVDITDAFRSAAAGLPVGVLVKDEFFPLQETVGALEIMDPKMDSGTLAPGEAFEDVYDAGVRLEPEEVLGIIDQLLCLEMAWHRGYPLSQTVLTSHHIDKLLEKETRQLPEARFSVAHPLNLPILLQALRAYCLALVKSCDLALETVQRSPYYEEEDFSTQVFNRVLLTPIETHCIIEVIDQVIQDLEALAVKNPDQEALKAILARITFRRDLLNAMSIDEDTDMTAAKWKLVCERNFQHGILHSASKPVPAAFSTKIQRKLYATAPPRPVIELDFDTAMEVLVKICNDCQEATKISVYNNSTVEGLKAFMWSFSSRQPPPLPYSRACLSSKLFEVGSFANMLRQDLTNWIFPSGDALDPADPDSGSPARYDDAMYRIEVSQCIGQFTMAATEESLVYTDIFRALCQNRCRMRRVLPNVLRDSDALEARAFLLDNELAGLLPTALRNPLSTWTLCQKLQITQWVIQLGFEQEVYLQHELAGMNWFLFRVCQSLLGFLTEISKHLLQEQHRGPLRPEQQAQGAASLRFLESLILRTRATGTLAEALLTVYTHLTYLKLIRPIEHPYGEPKLLFELRMRSILKSSHVAPDFESFHEATHPLGNFEQPTRDARDATAQICQHVERKVASAKGDFRKMMEEKLGARAAFAEGVQDWWQADLEKQIGACNDLLSSVTAIKEAAVKKKLDKLVLVVPDPGARQHDWWIVPKLST